MIVSMQQPVGVLLRESDATPDEASALPEWLKAHSQTLADESSMDYLARHSHSFRYAARFLPPPFDVLVADVYAFCRFTDDLVDVDAGSTPIDVLCARLEEWRQLARQAHAGIPCGFNLLDRPLVEMGRRGIPFEYADDLIEGVCMDLEHGSAPRRYDSLAALETYSYRVASVVGLWLTRLVGVDDLRVLERAADLGHAMQLTNILRDVGEDWRNGRLYLPLDVLARHGISEVDIAHAASDASGTYLPPGWSNAMEDLMAVADVRYNRALEAVQELPVFFRAPVTISGFVYRDIHTVLRRNGHDNLRRRAHTSKTRKIWLGLKARLYLARARVQSRPRFSASGGESGVRVPVTAFLIGSLFAASLLANPAPSAQQPPLSPKPRGVSAMHSAPEVPKIAGEADARARGDLARLDAALSRDPGNFELHLARLRVLHVLSVQDETKLVRAREARAQAVRLARSPRASGTGASADTDVILMAYRGALDVVEARHAFWPKARLEPLRRGLPLLDTAVRRDPDNAEVRYLRLTSTYYLPFFLGRKSSVREDFRALGSLLPAVRAAYPTDWYLAITAFVLEKGDLDEGTQRRLKLARAEASQERESGSAAATQPDYSRIP